MPYEDIFNKEAVKNAQRTSRTFNMTSNTYDFIPADRGGVLTEEAPLPSPEMLGDKSAAYCVCSDILKPIASDPTPMALRYLGTWAEGAAGLRGENLNLNDTDTADHITSLTTFCAGTETVSGAPCYDTNAYYAYAYDNIGNRLTAQEAEEQTAYTANNLNQYTAIQEGEAEAFAPTYDADGNQTLVKTSTGIWSVTYNAANRPTVFANEATGTVVECSYDSSGRRATKKVTVNGTVTLHQRYIYRGYLQIACCDLTRTAHPCLWLITRDPTQPIVTRPLAIQKDGTWYTYGFDLTKNVTEVFTTTGYIGTAYTYTPYGAVSASGNVTQPIQWSSEYLDTELGLVCYNYRHYNPAEGRWTGKDRINETGYLNLYSYVQNTPTILYDLLGMNGNVISFENRPCMEEISQRYLGDEITYEEVYRKSGGEVLKHYISSHGACAGNSCALRVSKSLAGSNSAVDRERGISLRMGEVHFKSDAKGNYNILEADALRKYITRIWGKPDMKFDIKKEPDNEKSIETSDWGLSVKGRCGIVFYFKYDKKGSVHATHTGLLVNGKPYRDSHGRTTRLAYVWFVPCSCGKCSSCKEKSSKQGISPCTQRIASECAGYISRVIVIISRMPILL